jgi:hypothetical protein
VAPVVVLAIALIAGLIWLFRFRIQRALTPAETLPPPPPTRAVSGGGEGLPAGLLYQTDFEDPAALTDWEAPFDDGIVSARFEDGMLKVGISALVDTGTWLALNYTFEDFVLDVDAAKLDGADDNGMMVLFRLVDAQNYNRFDISSEGWYTLSMVRDGLPVVISDFNLSEAIARGEAANHISIRAEGDRFTFSVNGETLELCVSEEEGIRPIWSEGVCLGGEVVTAWQNDDLLRGKIGLGAQGYTGFDGENVTPARTLIGFDNLVIVEP